MSTKKVRRVQHGMQGVFVFVLLGLFALMSTLMVLLGAQMYHNTVDLSTLNNEGRVLSAYVRSMVRAEDAAESIAVEEYDGIPVLMMREALDDDGFVTMLYCYEDQLYELYTSDDYDFTPQSGTAICPAFSFVPSFENGLLTVDMINAKGESETVRVALRCAQ